jgi:hypothetical protein
MPRARNIKPSFFTNEQLVELPYEARLMFIGLWTIADRSGRLEDRPKRIKMSLFPADDVDTDKMLNMLVKAGLILRYQVNNEPYIQVITFAKHQNPHVNERPSTIPAPEPNGATRADSLIPESLNLIPVSLKPEKKPSAPARADDGFNRFWQAYPKKKSKTDAEKAWKKIQPDEQLQDRIHRALEQAKTSADWTKDNGQFIPYPATWLNGRRWEDEVEPQRRDVPANRGKPTVSEYRQRLLEKANAGTG